MATVGKILWIMKVGVVGRSCAGHEPVPPTKISKEGIIVSFVESIVLCTEIRLADGIAWVNCDAAMSCRDDTEICRSMPLST